MDFKTFLENFDAIAEAPGGISKLRSLILDLAVRGKLVSQNPEDEPADELFKKIQEFREILYSKKKASRKKDFLPLNCDEIPFSIPRTWKWAKLHDLCWLITDGTHHTPTYVESGIPFLSVKDVSGGYLDFSNTRFVTREAHEELCTRCKPEYGDILLTKVGTTGIAVEIDIEQEFSIFVSVALLKHFPTFTYPKFLTHLLNSSFVKAQSKAGTEGVGNKNLVLRKIYNFVVPLPPLAEQKRIVAKVDELMGLCERYEVAKQTRDNLRQKLRESASASLMNAETDEELDAAWALVRDNWHNLSQYPQDVSDLRQAVLQLAVRGKLVPQNFEDEPVSVLLEKVEAEKRDLIKEKKLKERWNPVPVSPNAIPYKIPMNWKWIRILDGVERVTVGHVGSMQNEYLPEGVPFLRSQNVRENRFDPLGLKFISQEFHGKLAKSKLSPRDVVVVRSGNVGTTCVIPEELEDANCSDLVIVKRPMAIDSGFLSYYMNSAAKSHVKEGTVGIALTHFNTESVASLPIPLPPLAEQKRIVAKVYELMKLCDQLEVSLRQSQQRAENLAASAINHLTI